MHFFNISTSKTAPRPPVFNTFDFQMCFAPQRRALFRHRNLQKRSEPLVFCTFWLGNVLRATTACTFSTSQLPKVVRPWCVLYILTCKCASRHNGVHFFISHLASWLRTRRFSEPTFRPSGATNHWKNTVFRDFPTFSRICIFFLLTLSLLIFSLLIFLFSLPLPCSAFHLSILWREADFEVKMYKTLAWSNYRRKFRSQTSDDMDRWKQSRAEAETRERLEERRSEKRKSQKKEDADARKGRKVTKHCVFPMIWGSGGSKSRLAKAAGRSQLARWEMKKCTQLWREAHFEVKMYEHTMVRPLLPKSCGAKHISKSKC